MRFALFAALLFSVIALGERPSANEFNEQLRRAGDVARDIYQKSVAAERASIKEALELDLSLLELHDSPGENLERAKLKRELQTASTKAGELIVNRFCESFVTHRRLDLSDLALVRAADRAGALYARLFCLDTFGVQRFLSLTECKPSFPPHAESKSSSIPSGYPERFPHQP